MNIEINENQPFSIECPNCHKVQDVTIKQLNSGNHHCAGCNIPFASEDFDKLITEIVLANLNLK